MGNLLSGLEKIGLGNIKNLDILEKEDTQNKQGAEQKVANVVKEEDIIYDKTYRCPVCDNEFKSKNVMTGKAKLTGIDTDLRPQYKGIDCIKYDAVVCGHCGYSALTRYINNGLTSTQVKLVKDNISANFKPIEFEDGPYTYDQAILRFRLVLANSIIKRARMSERAYACLKLAWLYRGRIESLDTSDIDYANKCKEYRKEEMEFTKTAYEGFTVAMQKEMFPICGMDEYTFLYVTADLARRSKDFQVAVKLISQIITSRDASSKIKDRARDLKELIKQDIEG